MVTPKSASGAVSEMGKRTVTAALMKQLQISHVILRQNLD